MEPVIYYDDDGDDIGDTDKASSTHKHPAGG
jgi:hypothetical protein